MQLEELVPSLELCERLKEFGFPQNDSSFYWIKEIGTTNWFVEYRERFALESYLIDEIAIAAPLEGELLKIIPFSIIEDVYGDKISLMFHFVKMATNFYCASYVNATNYNDLYFLFKNKRPANSLAKALEWLIENGHVKFDK